MPKKYQVRVRGLEGEMKIINLCDTEEEMKNITVQQLKEKTWKEFPYITGEERRGGDLQLIFTDTRLNDDEARLCDYGIKHLSVIQMVLRVRGEDLVGWVTRAVKTEVWKDCFCYKHTIQQHASYTTAQ